MSPGYVLFKQLLKRHQAHLRHNDSPASEVHRCEDRIPQALTVTGQLDTPLTKGARGDPSDLSHQNGNCHRQWIRFAEYCYP
jgi:hypothetical protein